MFGAWSAASGRTRLNGAQPPARHLGLIVVDRAGVVRSVFSDAAGDSCERLLAADRKRLQPEIEATVQTLQAELDGPERRAPLLIRIGADYSVRLWTLLSGDKQLIALMIERDRISDAAVRFRLTPRQTDVLRLTLEGAKAGDIARTLNISEYTAQGYVKALLSKTGCRNRASMVAKVLEWEALPG